MAGSLTSFMVGPDHTVPLDLASTQTATVTVAATGSTVYYADKPYVTATSNQGSIANSSSGTFTSTVWLYSPSYTSVTVQYLDAGPAFLSGVTIGEGGNSQHTAIFTPRNAVLPEPVMTLQPVPNNLVCAMDIAPSTGATAQNNNGFAWIDVCDGPVQAANPYVGTSLRLGNGSQVDNVGNINVCDVSTRKFGAVTAKPLVLCADWDGHVNPQIYMSPRTNGFPTVILGFDGSDVITGPSAPIATNSTNHFLFVPTMAGAPSGTPHYTNANAGAALVVDTTNSKIMVNIGGTWKGVVVA